LFRGVNINSPLSNARLTPPFSSFEATQAFLANVNGILQTDFLQPGRYITCSLNSSRWCIFPLFSNSPSMSLCYRRQKIESLPFLSLSLQGKERASVSPFPPSPNQGVRRGYEYSSIFFSFFPPSILRMTLSFPFPPPLFPIRQS